MDLIKSRQNLICSEIICSDVHDFRNHMASGWQNCDTILYIGLEATSCIAGLAVCSRGIVPWCLAWRSAKESSRYCADFRCGFENECVLGKRVFVHYSETVDCQYTFWQNKQILYHTAVQYVPWDTEKTRLAFVRQKKSQFIKQTIHKHWEYKNTRYKTTHNAHQAESRQQCIRAERLQYPTRADYAVVFQVVEKSHASGEAIIIGVDAAPPVSNTLGHQYCEFSNFPTLALRHLSNL